MRPRRDGIKMTLNGPTALGTQMKRSGKIESLRRFAPNQLLGQRIQWLSLRPVILNVGWFSLQGTFGNVWRHLNLSKLGRGVIGIQWAEVRDAPSHLMKYRHSPSPKMNFSDQDINSAEVEKETLPFPSQCHWLYFSHGPMSDLTA